MAIIVLKVRVFFGSGYQKDDMILYDQWDSVSSIPSFWELMHVHHAYLES